MKKISFLLMALTALVSFSDSNIHYFSVNRISNNGKNGNSNNDGAGGSGSIAIGEDADAKEDGTAFKIAIGPKSKARGYNAISIGHGSSASEGSIAIGKSSLTVKNASYSMAIGGESKVLGHQGNALGHNSTAEQYGVSLGNYSYAGSSSVGVGYESKVLGSNSVGVGNQQDIKGHYSIGLGVQTAIASNASMAFGYNALSASKDKPLTKEEYSKLSDVDKKSYIMYREDRNNPIFFKFDKEAGGNIVIGDGSKGLGSFNTTIGGYSTADGDYSTATGVVAEAHTFGSVALGGFSIADRDTITKKTIESVYLIDDENVKKTVKMGLGAVSVGNKTQTRQITNVAPGSEDSDAVNLAQLKALDIKLNEKVDIATGGVANAIAMANLLQAPSFSDYRNQLSAAIGTFNNSYSVALGLSGVSEDRRVSYKVSGSVNNKGNLALGAGLGLTLGEVHSKDNKIQELSLEVEKLKKENAEMKQMMKEILDKIR